MLEDCDRSRPQSVLARAQSWPDPRTGPRAQGALAKPGRREPREYEPVHVVPALSRDLQPPESALRRISATEASSRNHAV